MKNDFVTGRTVYFPTFRFHCFSERDFVDSEPSLTRAYTKRNIYFGEYFVAEVEDAEGIMLNGDQLLLLPGSTFQLLSPTGNGARMRYLGFRPCERIQKCVLPFMLESALHYKNQELALQVMKKMKQFGLDLNMELPGQRQGHTAMHFAASNGLVAVLKFLVTDQGLTTFHVSQDSKSTPLHGAMEHGSAGCIAILLCASDSDKSLSQKNIHGLTPIEVSKLDHSFSMGKVLSVVKHGKSKAVVNILRIVQFDHLVEGLFFGFQNQERYVSFEDYSQEYVKYHLETVRGPIDVISAGQSNEDVKFQCESHNLWLQTNLSCCEIAFEDREDRRDEMVMEEMGNLQISLFNILLGKPEMSDLFVRNEKLYKHQSTWRRWENNLLAEGSRVTFNATTSTSTCRDVFLAGRQGVMFEIEQAQGIDVHSLSRYPTCKEKEILLLPGSTFEVLSKTDCLVRLRYLGIEVPESVQKQALPFMLETTLHYKKQDLALEILKKMKQYHLDLNMELLGQGYTVMYFAASNGLAAVLKFLVIDQGLPTFHVTRDSMSTPLHAAMENGHAACATILLGAYDSHKSMNHKNIDGLTPMEGSNNSTGKVSMEKVLMVAQDEKVMENVKQIVQFDHLVEGLFCGFEKQTHGEEKISMEVYAQEYVKYHTETVLEPIGISAEERKKIMFEDILLETKSYGQWLQRDLSCFGQTFEDPDDRKEAFATDVPLAYYAYTTNDFHSEVNNDLREMVEDLSKWQTLLFNILLGQFELAELFVYRERVYKGQSEWRGNEDQLLIEGSRVTFNTITSTSTCKDVALGFGGDEGVMFEIEQAKGIDVHSLSRYPSEKEIVLLPGSTFEVLAKTENYVKLRYVGIEVAEGIEKHILPFMLESALHYKEEQLALNVLKRMEHMKLDLNMELPGMKQNRTAVYYACRNGLGKVLKYLVVDRNVPTFQQIEEINSTPLHAAAYYGHSECVEILMSAPDIQKSLDHINCFGLTPVDEAQESVLHLLQTNRT
eukprot:TRINITY_DN2204_c0_g1_i1.p1 TRINITY_DN2204_c0_g1~~TRINITY_DN2204_c0_g1_i1.p1  ORF type:complete len:1048 (-),score=260.29 TRINITY_DN2204_c0_g1_i1:87-3092(-)